MVIIEILGIWIVLTSLYSLFCCLLGIDFSIFVSLGIIIGVIISCISSNRDKIRTFFTGYNEGKDSKLGGYYDRGKED